MISRLVAIGCLLAFSLTQNARLSAYQSVEDRRPLEHADYDLWNSILSKDLSNDGQWISYRVAPASGDATLVIRQIATNKKYTVRRGNRARFSFDSKFILFTISPDPDQIEKLKKEEAPPGSMPQPRLEILELETGRLTTLLGIERFATPAKASGWVAARISAAKLPSAVQESASRLTATYEVAPTGNRLQRTTAAPQQENETQASAATDEEQASEEKKNKKDKENGDPLVLFNLRTNIEQRIPFVKKFRFSEDGKYFVYTTSSDRDKEGSGDGVHLVDLVNGGTQQILSGLGNYGQVVFSKDGQQIAFLSDRDDYDAKQPRWSLFHWTQGDETAQKIVEPGSAGIPEGWAIAHSSAPLFRENGSLVWFRTQPIPAIEDADENAAEEVTEEKEKVAKLDIWHWQDPVLQPEQLLEIKRESNKSYRAIYDFTTKKCIQIETRQRSGARVDPRNNSNLVLVKVSDHYRKYNSWGEFYSDWYLVDLQTGEARMINEKARGNPRLSPAGKYVTWWDGEQKNWFALPTQKPEPGAKPTPLEIGAGIGHALHNELHDEPSLPSPYGSAGWLADDQSFLIYDRWDLWQVAPTGKEAPTCVTQGIGRQQSLQFRLLKLDPEARFVDLSKPQILSAFDQATKSSGFYQLDPAGESGPGVHSLIQLPERLSGLRKARDSEAVMFTRETFQRYPDIWVSDTSFKKLRRMSKANPQQQDFLWGTAELIKWQATDGQKLEGLLYKPEQFSPEKKYPLLLYFYERKSDELHRYHNPRPGRTSINYSFYVSRGYVVFVPDIAYKTGQPGPSAANAILPGVKHLVSKGYIDKDRIGMQGHSWGGYQTAYLTTVTDLFCCAEAGAPVSNMTSAYGGIRWGTGKSRMFQYEKQQSRIGATLWEAREKYIANSPLFIADKIKTPLLILHNDQDTAVPWYQGIELFVALRRLEKPAWMINYNGNSHWVDGDVNRLDFAKRMQQFFDHYLKGDPMPVWMAEGIPAVDKGKQLGFEYPQQKQQTEPAASKAEKAETETSRTSSE